MSVHDAHKDDVSESRQEAGDHVIVVSGLPRSGTSMLMQMLVAGGIEALTDEQRKADEFNPFGYYEYEPVKQIEQDPDWLRQARGRAVKIVIPLVNMLSEKELPARVLLIKRDIAQVLSSQYKMAEGRGHHVSKSEQERLSSVMVSAYTHSRDLLAVQSHISLLELEYEQVLRDPANHALRIQEFLAQRLDSEAMVKAVDTSRISART